MNVFVTDSYEEMSRAAADVIATLVAEKPDCVLGLATGSTPIGLYAELVKDYEAGKIKMITLPEYEDRVIKFLEHLSPDIVLQRIIGRAPEEKT